MVEVKEKIRSINALEKQLVLTKQKDKLISTSNIKKSSNKGATNERNNVHSRTELLTISMQEPIKTLQSVRNSIWGITRL